MVLYPHLERNWARHFRDPSQRLTDSLSQHCFSWCPLISLPIIVWRGRFKTIKRHIEGYLFCVQNCKLSRWSITWKIWESIVYSIHRTYVPIKLQSGSSGSCWQEEHCKFQPSVGYIVTLSVILSQTMKKERNREVGKGEQVSWAGRKTSGYITCVLVWIQPWLVLYWVFDTVYPEAEDARYKGPTSLEKEIIFPKLLCCMVMQSDMWGVCYPLVFPFSSEVWM